MRLRRGSRASRVAALGLLLAIPAVAWIGLVEPYRELRLALAERIAGLSHELRVHQRIAGTRPRYEQAQAELLARPELRSWFIAADTPALAAAELQGWMSAAAREAGVDVRSIRAGAAPGSPDRDEAPGGRVAEVEVELVLRAEIAELTALLHRVESEPRLLRIDALSVRSRHTGRASVAGEEHRGLDVGLTLTAYRMAPER